ncbi:polysaccharide biosynthesis/export family protein [Frigoriflavimonas asaccharolytica]|uniref:Polysaccharide export outer membrane protein n=1 Tax=Frigoriflavimonas asaccharolytica TaxID=2735899 RepID=A0A8J8K3S2_9FLAO|nr:polysaccharide biosynthesis/export family protein [Frigoriflavimonas asaccharolytica]NRS90945.1 polysaccharide export outer membrane protein [Frigoriflavimonas asaccharolytica]
MKKIKLLILLVISLAFTSCISTKEIKYAQPSESLVINEEGLVPYNIQEYRVTKNDILKLDIVTTPKGDAAQFYSSLNANSAGVTVVSGESGTGNATLYFSGLKVDSKGDINVFGIGYLKAEGKTLEEIAAVLQGKVNENFVEGKSEVRLNLNGITYYILGDIESTGLTGEKVSHTQTLNLYEAIAQNGGLNRTIDRKSVTIKRKLPEGIKTVKLDLTREDIMNSPYFYIQNGDMIFLNTSPKAFFGFGNTPIQSITTAVSAITTALSIYLILSRL